jgi:hypothetical protein
MNEVDYENMEAERIAAQCDAHRSEFGLSPDTLSEEDCENAKCNEGCPLK